MVDQVTADVRTATGGWWLLLLVGVLSIAAGVTILIKPGDSLATLAVIAGGSSCSSTASSSWRPP